MKKNYEVLVTGYASVLVIGAASKKEAQEFAVSELSKGDFNVDDTRIEREVDEDSLDSVRRNVDCVSEDC